MMRVRWAGADFFAADVWKNAFGILRVFGDQAVHFGNGRGDALFVGIVKGKAHAQQNAALKAFARVGGQAMWIVVSSGMKQKCCDLINLAAIEFTRRWRHIRTAF